MSQKKALEIVLFYTLAGFMGLSLAYAQDQGQNQGQDAAEAYQESLNQEDSEYYEEDPYADPYAEELYEEPGANEGYDYQEDWRGPAAIDEQDYQDLMELDQEEDVGDPDVYEGELDEPDVRPEAFEYREYREQGENLD